MLLVVKAVKHRSFRRGYTLCQTKKGIRNGCYQMVDRGAAIVVDLSAFHDILLEQPSYLFTMIP